MAQILKQAVRTFLVDELGVDEDVGDGDALFSSNLLDSMMSVQLMVYIESEFGKSISPLDVSLDDFDSIEKICETIARLP